MKKNDASLVVTLVLLLALVFTSLGNENLTNSTIDNLTDPNYTVAPEITMGLPLELLENVSENVSLNDNVTLISDINDTDTKPIEIISDELQPELNETIQEENVTGPKLPTEDISSEIIPSELIDNTTKEENNLMVQDKISGDIGILTVFVPVINTVETIPPNVWHNLHHNTSFVLKVNATDADQNLVAVNFTVTAPNGSYVIYNENASSYSGDFFNSATINVSHYGYWNYTIYAIDADGVFSIYSSRVNVLNITISLNKTISDLGEVINVKGHINGGAGNQKNLSLTISINNISITPYISNESLIGYWKFDDALGTTVADISGNGNNGFCTKCPLVSDGKFNTSFRFNDTTSIEFNKINSLNTLQNFSIALYAYMTGNSSYAEIGTYNQILAHKETFDLGISPQGNIYLNIQNVSLINNWVKYSSNPVLTAGANNQWDDTNVSAPSIIKAENGTYQMWYTGRDDLANQFRIGYATSSDGKSWTKYPTYVLNKSTGAGFDSDGVMWPSVIKRNGTYMMWYTGYDVSATDDYKIGFAVSRDGINWSREATYVLNTGATWETDSVMYPTVIFENNTYKMWYAGRNVTSLRYKLGYATSTNGITWAKSSSNPILANGVSQTWEDTSVMAPHVIKDGNTYEMWYIGTNNTYYNVGYAYSYDGINWVKATSNPIFNGTAGDWDSRLGRVSVIKDANKYKMWYTGTNSRDQIGYAEATVGIASNPVFTPNEWSSIVATKDGSVIKLYKDGVMMASGISTLITFTSNSNLTLGKYFNGSIDDVRIYGRALNQFEISNLALKTNSTGDYSVFIQSPLEAGSYEIKINATVAADYGEANITLLVDDISDINSFYTVPINPYYTGDYGSVFYIEVNVTDGDDPHPLNVNFTLYSSNGSIVMNNVGAVSRSGDLYQSETYRLDNFGEWNYTIVTFDDSGGNDTAIGFIRFLQVVQYLNKTVFDVGDSARVTGHIYDSHWNDVVNTSIFLYLDGMALNVTDGWNFNNPLLWWNTSYRFRMKFQADNMANLKLNNSLIYVNVSTSSLISQGWMNDDCGDVRFSDFTGNMLSHTVVESSCNSANTLFWIWMNMSATSNTSFYMYFGNVGAQLNINFTNPDKNAYMVLHFDNSSVYGENDTFVTDFSGLDHNGSVSSATLTSDCPNGKCFDFDADGEYIEVADSQKLQFGNGSRDYPFSITSWVKMRNYGNFTVLFKTADILNAEYGLYTNKTGHLILSLHDNYPTDFFYEVSNSSLSSYVDQWIFLAATYSGTPAKNSIKLYLNGEQLASINQTNRSYVAMHNDANPIFIGFNPLTGKSADGIIDEMRIYNKTLGQEEIRAFYNMTRITFMLNDSMLKTDKNGNFNYTFRIPSLGNGDYEFKVNATYNSEYGEDNQTISITDYGNLAPTVLAVNISPAQPNKLIDLKCNVTAYDVENTTFTVEWIWYNSSMPFSGGNLTVTNYSSTTVATLDNSFTEVGENWNCTVRAYDGYKNSSYSSRSVTIQNEVPIITNVAILPLYPNGTTDLGCYATARDSENASTLVYYQWYNLTEYDNLEIVAGSTLVTNNTLTLITTLGENNISGKETWMCNVTSFDGIGYSSNGYATTYVNNLPYMSEPVILPLNAGLSSSLVCNITDLTESDGESVYNLTAWYKNNEPIYALYMPFEANGNDTTLTTRDYSGNDNHGIIYGANWTSSGKVGGAYEFNGSNYILVQDNSALDFDADIDFTIEGWFNSKGSVYSQGIIAKRDGNGGQLVISLLNTSELNVYLKDINNNITLNSSIISLNTWTHFAVVADRNMPLKIFIDGQADSESNISSEIDISNTNPLEIGIANYSIPASIHKQFNGSIDEIKIYRQALSPEQIYQEYQDGLANINSVTIVSKELHLGDEWYCAATPNDGYADGIKLTSNVTTIISMAATMDYPNVTPQYPNVTSNLTCNWINLTSVSGYPVVNITTWYRDYSPLSVLYMPFEGNNNYEDYETKDYSGYTNDGVVYGATWNRTGGKVGGAYEFDGVDDYINISYLFDPSATDFSAFAWIRSNNPVSDQAQIILQQADLSGTGRSWLYFNASGKFGTNLNASQLTYPETLSADSFYYVGVTYDSQTKIIDLYLNGTLVNSTLGNVESSLGNIWIGSGKVAPNAVFNGSIDEVKIYDYILTEEQIWSDYQAGLMNTTTNVMVSNETVGGGDFFCSVVPNDGYEDGSAYDSDPVHVVATPYITSVRIVQTSGTTIADIHCNATIMDSDNSSLYVNYSWYNITAGNNDLFSTGMTSVSTGGNSYVATLSSAYLGRDGMWNCTIFAYDGVLYSTEKSGTIIVDVDIPQITLNHPTNSQMLTDNHYTLNYTIRETNIDSAWYTLDENTDKTSIAKVNGTNTNAIIFSYPGKHNLTVHVNDTLGSEVSDSAIIYLNYSFDPNAWAALLKINIPNATTVSVLNFTSNLLFSSNTTVNQNFTIQVNFSNSTLEIIGMPGLESTWSFFTASDNSSNFVTDIINNQGAIPIDYIVVWNFTNYLSNASKYYAKVRMTHNSSYYTSIYYCSDDSITCNKISQCTATYLISTTEPCYSTNNYVLVPHLSAVYAINDSIPPTITISSPTNNSVSADSYNILLSATTNENATCKYSFNNLAYSSLSGSKSFSTTFSYYVNSRNNITMNCTDLFGNSRLSRIYFNISDTTEPDSSLSYSIGTDYIRVTITLDEPSNATAVIIGNASRTNTSYGLSHVLEFTGLSASTTYQLNYTFCDQLRNCGSKSAQKTTDSVTVAGGGTTGGSGGGGTTGGTTTTAKFSEIWQGLTAGEHTMNIANAKIAFTKLIFILIRDVSGAIQLSVESKELPGSIPPLEGRVYQYLEVQKTTMTDADISGATIRFRVENNWINNYNIDTDQIYLYRYNSGEWWKLTTAQTSQDSGYTYYEATSPGFSYFAIVGFEKPEEPPHEVVVETPPTGEVVNPPVESPPEEPPSDGSNQSGIGGILFMFIILAVVLSAVGAFMLYQKKETEKQQKTAAKQELSEIKEYIATCKLQGLDDNSIRSTLLNSGWSQQQIEQAFMSMSSKPLSQVKPLQPSQLQPSQLSQPQQMQLSQITLGKPVIVQPLQEMDSEITEIKDYIKTTRQQGFTDEQIKAALGQVGWEEDQIKKGFM
ncbi:MAG: DUF2341 domain-containing protein [archaeon]